MADTFPTEAYEESGLPICPNGDQVRSDGLGLFCWIDGERAPVELVNGKVRLLLPDDKKSKSKFKLIDSQTESEGK